MSKYHITDTQHLQELDCILRQQMYVHGHQPGKEDALLYFQYTKAKSQPDYTTHPYLHSWFNLVSLYNHQVFELWKNVKAEKKEKTDKPGKRKDEKKKAAEPTPQPETEKPKRTMILNSLMITLMLKLR